MHLRYTKLNFSLTNDQAKTLNEINNDLCSDNKMFRLLQGDVGSGKTIVSLLSAFNTINSDFQVAVMAPTEILARQHFLLAKKIFPKNIKIEWVVKSKKNPSGLENTVKKINWLNGKPYVWVACEFNKMKILRNFFQKNKKISKNEMYISSYWKLGLDQEEHKLVKKEDSVKWDNN